MRIVCCSPECTVHVLRETATLLWSRTSSVSLQLLVVQVDYYLFRRWWEHKYVQKGKIQKACPNKRLKNKLKSLWAIYTPTRISTVSVYNCNCTNKAEVQCIWFQITVRASAERAAGPGWYRQTGSSMQYRRVGQEKWQHCSVPYLSLEASWPRIVRGESLFSGVTESCRHLVLYRLHPSSSSALLLSLSQGPSLSRYFLQQYPHIISTLPHYFLSISLSVSQRILFLSCKAVGEVLFSSCRFHHTYSYLLHRARGFSRSEQEKLHALLILHTTPVIPTLFD